MAQPILQTHSTSFRMVGLKNAIGEQNCFLNVVIQALWRLRCCRDFFFSIEDPWKKSNPVLVALTALMTEYKYSDEKILPPDQVRLALADVFTGLRRFQLGEMDDAGESFEAILTAMHGGELDKPCKDRDICLGHQVFALDFVNEEVCKMCKNYEHNEFGTMFSFHLYAQEVVETHEPTLSKVIRTVHRSKRKECNKCHGPNTVEANMVVISLPKVWCVNLVWPTIEADRSLLRSVLKLIGASLTDFRLDEAFSIPDGSGQVASYLLSGMICFYPGGHYVYFGLISPRSVMQSRGLLSSASWAIFDDHQIKPVGTFEQVIERCERAKYQPVCLFYEQCGVVIPLAIPMTSSSSSSQTSTNPPPPPQPTTTATSSPTPIHHKTPPPQPSSSEAVTGTVLDVLLNPVHDILHPVLSLPSTISTSIARTSRRG